MNRITYKEILGAGFFTLLGSIIGAFITWGKEADINQRKFEHSLVQEALSIDDGDLRRENISFYVKSGLISSINTDSLEYHVNYQYGLQRGRNEN